MTDNRIMQLGNMAEDTPTYKNRTRNRVYSINGLCPTINTSGGGQREPRVIVRNIRYDDRIK